MPEFMTAADFKIGVMVRAGRGYTCLEEGSTHKVVQDGNGTPCIRCRFKGQLQPGWHYPLDPRAARPDGLLNELYLVQT